MPNCVSVSTSRHHKLTHFSKNIIAILFSFRNIWVSLSQYLLDEYSGVIRDSFSIAEYLSDICCWLVTCSTWNKTNYNVSTRFTNSKSSQVKIDLINLRWVSLTTIDVYLKYSVELQVCNFCSWETMATSQKKCGNPKLFRRYYWAMLCPKFVLPLWVGVKCIISNLDFFSFSGEVSSQIWDDTFQNGTSHTELCTLEDTWNHRKSSFKLPLKESYRWSPTPVIHMDHASIFEQPKRNNGRRCYGHSYWTDRLLKLPEKTVQH